mgnify:CR=1 FL=1
MDTMKKATIPADLVNAMRDAVKADTASAGKWQKAGTMVATHYVTREAFEAVKADYVAVAIVPALRDDYQIALAATRPTKDASPAMHEAWKAVQATRKDAKAAHATYWARIMRYAFPKVATEGEAEGEGDDVKASAEFSAKAVKALGALLKKTQEDESPTYDHAGAVKALNAALAAFTAHKDYGKAAQNAEKGSGQRRTK